jgi:hypothetical protein
VSRAVRFLRCPLSTLSISNSSNLWPVSRAATTHRGRFPLPDHVSDGARGLQYLGRTFGYLRRGARSVIDSASGGALVGSLISTRFNFAKRLSNSRFSETILSDRIFVSSSWSIQSSSNCIAARFDLCMAFLVTVRLETINRSLDKSLCRRHIEMGQSLHRRARRQSFVSDDDQLQLGLASSSKSQDHLCNPASSPIYID